MVMTASILGLHEWAEEVRNGLDDVLLHEPSMRFVWQNGVGCAVEDLQLATGESAISMYAVSARVFG